MIPCFRSGSVDDLLDRLTLDERLAMLHQYRPAGTQEALLGAVAAVRPETAVVMGNYPYAVAWADTICRPCCGPPTADGRDPVHARYRRCGAL
ncbi:hypothetical protein [Streptomyces sp. NPDC002550]